MKQKINPKQKKEIIEAAKAKANAIKPSVTRVTIGNYEYRVVINGDCYFISDEHSNDMLYRSLPDKDDEYKSGRQIDIRFLINKRR